MNPSQQPSVGNPWTEILKGRGFLVLDGGLASEIERRGVAIAGDPLWSARLLLDNPSLLEDIHLAYAQAGADILTTATYQASLPGLTAAGLSAIESRAVLAKAVHLAQRVGARWAQSCGVKPPLVAASIGPYGAYLADGSEYTGAYTQDKATLRAFHEKRIEVLSESGADILACESIPSLAEGEVLLDLLAAYLAAYPTPAVLALVYLPRRLARVPRRASGRMLVHGCGLPSCAGRGQLSSPAPGWTPDGIGPRHRRL